LRCDGEFGADLAADTGCRAPARIAGSNSVLDGKQFDGAVEDNHPSKGDVLAFAVLPREKAAETRLVEWAYNFI
jgi:hypothetical protein